MREACISPPYETTDKVVVLYNLFSLYSFRYKGEGKVNDARHSLNLNFTRFFHA